MLRLMDRKTVEMARAVVSFGCMIGSAMASPILFELRKIWFWVIVVFFVSATTFLLHHRAEIKTYWPFTLLLAILLGLTTLATAHTFSKELVPWIPITICLLAILTVHSLPLLHQALKGAYPDEITEVEQSDGFYDLHGQPRPNIPIGRIHTRESDLEMDHLLGHMGRPLSRMSELSIHGSDIDLPEQAEEIMRIVVRNLVSPSQDSYTRRFSTQSIGDDFYLHAFVASRPAMDSSEDMNCSSRSASPDSYGSPESQSISGELENLLQR